MRWITVLPQHIISLVFNTFELFSKLKYWMKISKIEIKVSVLEKSWKLLLSILIFTKLISGLCQLSKGFIRIIFCKLLPFTPFSFSVIRWYIALAFLPSFFMAPNTLFWNIQNPDNCELWLTNSSQLLYHLILYVYMQATSPHLSLPPLHNCPLQLDITLFFHLANSLTEFWVAGIGQTSIWTPLPKMALRWRTKTLQLQSRYSSFCTEGVSDNPC